MKCFFILFSVVATIIVVFGNQNDCKIKCNRPPHIGCGHNNLFARPACPGNARIISMTNDLKTFLTNAHNEKRNIIAGAENSKFKPACRMPTMKWDDELARLAELNVKQCQMKHDRCRDTYKFEDAGQNLHRAMKTFQVTDKEWLQTAVNSWYNEEKQATQSNIDYLTNIPGILHFTVMMSDRNTHLGCAAATYTKGKKIYVLTACNYAGNNWMGKPVYEKCSKSGERCKARNRIYGNLCAAN